MDRSTLAGILDHAEGISGSDHDYSVAEGHRLAFYLGRPGQAMILGEVLSVQLHQGFVQLDRKSDEGSVYVDYDAIHGLAVRPSVGRAGFA